MSYVQLTWTEQNTVTNIFIGRSRYLEQGRFQWSNALKTSLSGLAIIILYLLSPALQVFNGGQLIKTFLRWIPMIITLHFHLQVLSPGQLGIDSFCQHLSTAVNLSTVLFDAPSHRQPELAACGQFICFHAVFPSVWMWWFVYCWIVLVATGFVYP